MATDNERREVARRLREPFDVIGQGRYVALNGTLFGMQLLASDEGTLRAGIARLADLIEPSCDRDELLELADEMDRDGKMQRAQQKDGEHWFIDELDVRWYARRIREACGEVEPCDEQS